jgi:hypothetical protein
MMVVVMANCKRIFHVTAKVSDFNGKLQTSAAAKENLLLWI